MRCGVGGAARARAGHPGRRGGGGVRRCPALRGHPHRATGVLVGSHDGGFVCVRGEGAPHATRVSGFGLESSVGALAGNQIGRDSRVSRDLHPERPTPRDDDSHQSTLAPGVHRTSRVAVPRLVAAEASYEPRKRGTHILCFVLEKTVDDELK